MNNRTLSYFSLFLFFFSFCLAARGQVAHVVPSARSVAQTAVADDASWNAFHNPAMLGYIRPVDLSVAYENRYLLKELSTKSIQAGFATPYVNVGASFSHFGYSLYHDMLMGIDVARDFGGKFALGLGFDYYMAYVAATGRYQGALLGRIGLSLRLVDRLVIGFSTFNPFQNNLRMELTTKRLPSVYSLGTAFYILPELVWRTQADKEISSRYRFATGLEYSMLGHIRVKAGGYATGRIFVPCLGFAARVSDYSADLDCELNPVLGLTAKITLHYALTPNAPLK